MPGTCRIAFEVKLNGAKMGVGKFIDLGIAGEEGCVCRGKYKW